MHKAASFSLIEILVSLALFMLLASLALPRFSFLRKEKLYQETSTLASTFIYLQQRSLASRNQQILFIDFEKQSYRFRNEHNKEVTHTLPTEVVFDFLAESRGPPSRPEKHISQAITFPQSSPTLYQVAFYSDGNVSPGTIYLCDSHKVFMNALTYPLGGIGEVRTYRYDQKKWILL